MLDLLKNQPIWVTWKFETVKDKRTKVPYQLNGNKAATDTPATWTTHALAEAHPAKDGVGIVFESTQDVVGIDFDHCLARDIVPLWLQDFLDVCDSYIEYSPSATGCHVLFRLTAPVELTAHKHYFDEDSHVEVYSSGRYFTFTGDAMPGATQEPRTLEPDEFLALLALLGYPWKKPAPELIERDVPPPATVLSDEDLLRRMFAAKNGQKVRTLWDGSLEDHHNDGSSGDMALCCHLAFWSGRDKSQMERLWLSSPLGQRPKTVAREDYRRMTIDRACEATGTVYVPITLASSQNDGDWTSAFVMTGDKHPVPALIFPNVALVIRHDPAFKDKFRKNDFSHMTETCFLSDEWLSLSDDVISHAREYVSDKYRCFSRVSKDMMTEAILHASCYNRVNPPRDYFSNLTWDKVPRLNAWIHHAYGTPDDELHQAIGSNWLKGLVKRVILPGCQFDEVLALESPQGWRKSSSIRALGEPWHVETTHSLDSKDFYLTIAQNVIVEFSEGDIFDRSSMKKIKAEITKTEDQVRPPYERGIIRFKRSCVFAVTTNQLELKDDTGNRRWLPVRLEKVADIDWIKQNRDQLFAEAYHRVIVLGETTHEYPTDSLAELQASRAEHSDYDDLTIQWYATLMPSVRDDGISVLDAIAATRRENYNPNKSDEMIMGSILRRSLHLENRNKRIDGLVLRRWFPSDKTRRLIKDVSTSYGNQQPVPPPLDLGL